MRRNTRIRAICLVIALFLGIGVWNPTLSPLASVGTFHGTVAAAPAAAPTCPPPGSGPVVASGCEATVLPTVLAYVNEDFVVGSIRHVAVWENVSSGTGWRGWYLQRPSSDQRSFQALIDDMSIRGQWVGPSTLNSLPGTGDLRAHVVTVQTNQIQQTIARSTNGVAWWSRTVPIQNGTVMWGQASTWR